MTVYNWSSMTPRERDSLVAEKVFGWRNVKVKRDGIWGNPPWQKRWLWNTWRGSPWSSDISAAWEVVEKMKTLPCPQQEIFHDETNFTLFNITPEAICLAALKAVGVEIQ